MRGFLTVMMILAATGLQTGCSGTDRPAWFSLNPNEWANRGTVDEPITFEVSHPIAVDVNSFHGDVMIRADPKLEKATVTIVREAHHGSGRTDEAKQSLAEITATAEIVPGELGQLLQVRALTNHAEPHFQRAHVYIEAPEIEGVKVRTSTGKVYAVGVRGEIDIETSEDDVRVLTNLALTQPITILNRNADIDVRTRGESTANIDAQTVNGQVMHIVRYGTLTIGPQTSSDALKAVLNAGTNPVVLRTVKGDIRFAVVHNPEEVGKWIVD
jgi:hypothetical protein